MRVIRYLLYVFCFVLLLYLSMKLGWIEWVVWLKTVL